MYKRHAFCNDFLVYHKVPDNTWWLPDGTRCVFDAKAGKITHIYRDEPKMPFVAPCYPSL